MPITPLHALILLPLYFRYREKVDPLAITASAMLVDLEPLYHLLLNERPHHRVWHGLITSLTIYPIIIAIGVFIAERIIESELRSLYGFLWLRPVRVKYGLLNAYFCSLIGGASHVFLDALTHENMPYAVYPIAYGNPLYVEQVSVAVNVAVILMSLYSCMVWLRLRKREGASPRY